MRTLFICIFLALCFSCKENQSQKNETNQNLEKDFLDCLVSKIEKNPGGDSEEFFKYLMEMEDLTINMNYLEQSSKKGYVVFLKKLHSDNSKIKTLLNELDKQVPNFSNFSLTSVLFSNKSCLYEVLEANPKSKFPERRIYYFEKLEHSGFDDYDSFIKYIELIDFENVKDRLLLYSVLYNYMYLKANP